jgi:hypothetical protein
MLGKGIVTIVFDDNDASIYTEGFSYMQPLGLVGTHACITGTVGDSGLLTEAQVQEMYNAGWDIVNHTRSHTDMTTQTLQDATDDVSNGYNDLGSFGWTRSRNVLIPPNNGITETILNNITTWVDVCTTNTEGGRNIANSYPFDVLRIRRRGVANNDPEVIKDWIDDAILNNQHIHLNFHKITDGGTGLDYPPADFVEVMDHIKTRKDSEDLLVMTMSELSTYLTDNSRDFRTRRKYLRDTDGSLYFDGSGDSISVPYSAVYTPSGSQSYSVSFKVNTSRSDSTQRILAQGTTRLVRISGTTKRFELLLNGLTPDRITAGAVTSNQWQFVSLVFDGSWYRCYVDGRLVGRTAVTAGSHTSNTSAWTVGHGSSEQFRGYLRDIRMWKRALTHQEVIDLYYDGTVPSGQTLTLLLDEGSGTTANDTSGNGNNGTITGAAWSSYDPT